MLWIPYPSVDSLLSDSCSRLFPRSDIIVFLASPLSKVDLSAPKCGGKRLCLQQRDSVAGTLHRCVEAQALWKGSELVLEEMSSAQTLEAQLASIRIRDSSEEGLARRVAEDNLFDESYSYRHKPDRGESNTEAEVEGQDSASQDTTNRPHLLQVSEDRPASEISAFTAGSSESNSNVYETMLYLESVGVDCSRLISQDPTAVNCGILRVRKLVHALEYYGLKRKDLGRIFNMCPKILHLSVEKHVKLVVSFLMDEVGLPPQDFSKVIKRCPRLLACSVSEQLRPTLKFLRALGFSRMGRVVSNNATLLAFSIEKKLVPKLKYLQSLGISDEDAVIMVIKFPALFNYSAKENILPKYDYFVNEMCGKLHVLIGFPQYFGYSLESRIKPRHRCITEHNIRLSLQTMLMLSEIEFALTVQGSKTGHPSKVTLR